MERGHEDDLPLFIGDITGAEPTARAIQADIDEVGAAMQEGGPAERQVLEAVSRAQRYTREVSFGVLRRLSDMDIDDADVLTQDLQALDPDATPFAAGLSEVAWSYDEQAADAADPDEQATMRQRASLARASFGIATAQAVRWILPKESLRAEILVEDAQLFVREAADDVSTETHIALLTLVNELAATIQLPPQE